MSKMINFRMPDELAASFERRVKADGRSVSEVMVALVRDWLDGPSISVPAPTAPLAPGRTQTRVEPSKRKRVLEPAEPTTYRPHVDRLKGHWRPR